MWLSLNSRMEELSPAIRQYKVYVSNLLVSDFLRFQELEKHFLDLSQQYIVKKLSTLKSRLREEEKAKEVADALESLNLIFQLLSREHSDNCQNLESVNSKIQEYTKESSMTTTFCSNNLSCTKRPVIEI